MYYRSTLPRILLISFGLNAPCALHASTHPSPEILFTTIYQKYWRSSGSGSYVHNVRPYMQFLEQFLQEKQIRSVVDIGCGDWQFSRYIDWQGINYTGYDVVKYIIEQNHARFGSSTIRFIHADALLSNLPAADLLICKDVLQHLRTEEIQRLITQLHKFKYCLITNDILEKNISTNPELPDDPCPWRKVDLTKPPFQLPGSYIFAWNSENRQKGVLFLTQPTPAATPQRGFITYATQDYFPLVTVLVRSVHRLSIYPIVVVGINADFPASSDFPRLICKRLDIPITAREQAFLLKPQALLAYGLAESVYVDADIILNRDCDKLFAHMDCAHSYPLCPLFPYDVDNAQQTMQQAGIHTKTMHYVHAPLIIFTDGCRPFLQEWQELTRQWGLTAPCHDETTLNLVFWKQGITNHWINLCDPYYELIYDYLTGATTQHRKHGYTSWYGKIDFYTFHGCKDPAMAELMLATLSEHDHVISAQPATPTDRDRSPVVQ